MNRPKRFKLRSFYVWHRYTGLACVVIILGLVVTGLLLQHSDSLRLPFRHPGSWLVKVFYNLNADKVTAYKTEKHWVSQSGSVLFVDSKPVNGSFGALNGAVETDYGLVIAEGTRITLLTNEGALIDSLSPGDGLPDAAEALAVVKDNIIVKGAARNWKTDNSFLNWQAFDAESNWIEPTTAPVGISQAIQKYSLSRQISWERLLLDMHSGRLFGTFGIWIFDAAAIGMLFLSFTGCWLWIQSIRKHKLHRK